MSSVDTRVAFERQPEFVECPVENLPSMVAMVYPFVAIGASEEALRTLLDLNTLPK